MAVVLVHGNPETPVVWDPLVERLGALGVADPVRLSPPGFGAPVPDGWGATVLEYRDWLVAELEAIGHPVDLVGHDFGGVYVVAAVMVRPELARSWCSDVLGLFDRDYVWHDLARVWQTPGEGEVAIAEWVDESKKAVLAGRFASAGLGQPTADRVVAGIDETMADCILRVYRSAAQPVLAELGAGLELVAARPGLAVIPTEDRSTGTDEQRFRAAVRAGARAEVLDGAGHWWFTQDPGGAARVLTDFWRSV
jgi:pimeloyl-ACP methyl ester carboxylesterase